MSFTPGEVIKRGFSHWFSLAYLAMFGYLDYITHRSLPFVIVVAGIAAALMLFPEEIAKQLNLGPALRSIPSAARPFLWAAPGLLYFLTRGQGTSGAGPIVVFATLGAVAAIAFFGRELDRRLAGFYVQRDRYLPELVRYVLAIVLPIVLSFLLIHGNLADIKAMFGGTTSSPKRPTGLDARFFVAVVLAAAVAFLLTRDKEVAVPSSIGPSDPGAEDPTSEPPTAPKPSRRSRGNRTPKRRSGT